MSGENAQEHAVAARFAGRMQALRKHRGLSQTQLAIKTDMPRSAICEIEIGRRRCSIGEAWVICGALGVSLEAMVSPEDLVLTLRVPIGPARGQ